MEPDLPPNADQPGGPPEPAPRADNDQQLAADLTRYERVLTAARDDADAQEHLGAVGYGPERLDGLLALVASARTAYEARTTAMVAQGAASAAKTAAFDSASASLYAFRKIARALFRDDDGALDALELTDEPPRALDPFATHARSSYAGVATLAPEKAATLAEAGYTSERLATLTGEVQDLVDAARDLTAAESRAKKATATRDGEAEAAAKAYGTFRDIARTVLPPDLRDRIGLD